MSTHTMTFTTPVVRCMLRHLRVQMIHLSDDLMYLQEKEKSEGNGPTKAALLWCNAEMGFLEIAIHQLWQEVVALSLSETPPPKRSK